MRPMILLTLVSMGLVVVGCSRNIVLRATDEPGSAGSYTCSEKNCTTTDKIDPATYNQSRTTFRALPAQCGKHGIEKILILNAGSQDPKVIITCAAPSQSIGTMGSGSGGR